MITWMQRHKKYLVVTIWISVIAFVGAGFVGWGAYDFNSDKASAVAKVGDRKITVSEFQQSYGNYYNFYSNMLGGKLTQEKAKQMGLEKMVLEAIINETLLLAYADEIGLRTNDKEIKAVLTSDKVFQEKGVFNKSKYYSTLKQARIKPKNYENGLKKQILLSKVNKILNLKPTDAERELFLSSMFMKDKLSVKVISLNKGDAIVTEKENKKYWDENKNNYLTTKSYDLETLKVALTTEKVNADELKTYYDEKKYNYKGNDGKILSFENAKTDVEKDFRLKLTKKVALKTYLKFKKDEIKATGSKNVKIDSQDVTIEKIKTANAGDVLKPIEDTNGYLIVRVKKINKPEPKPFIEAKQDIVDILQAKKNREVLETKAKANLKDFKGKDIGFIGRDSLTKVANLSAEDSVDFINSVFDTNSNINYKIIGNKAVLYKILEQKLLDSSKAEKYATMINENISQMKQAEIGQNLTNILKQRYTVEQYYKGN